MIKSMFSFIEERRGRERGEGESREEKIFF